MNEVAERVAGRSGELVLRSRGDRLEVILNGAFLISSENEASSRALVAAGLAALEGGEQRRLDVLIGGLGLGYALDEALESPRVGVVTVVEYEPVVVRWFEKYGARRAARAADAARGARLAVEVADVCDVLSARPGAFDLVCLDTDNGPGWLVREANAGLYDEAGIRLAHGALRLGGAVVFWSTQRYPEFEARLRRVFGALSTDVVYDRVAGRLHDYVMYVALRVD